MLLYAAPVKQSTPSGRFVATRAILSWLRSNDLRYQATFLRYRVSRVEYHVQSMSEIKLPGNMKCYVCRHALLLDILFPHRLSALYDSWFVILGFHTFFNALSTCAHAMKSLNSHLRDWSCQSSTDSTDCQNEDQYTSRMMSSRRPDWKQKLISCPKLTILR